MGFWTQRKLVYQNAVIFELKLVHYVLYYFIQFGKMQQVLLNKVENIKKDFEKCSKLISRHKTTDLQEAKIEDKKPAKVEQKHRVVQKGRKNIKKDYLNWTPVIQVEILAEERSPFHHKEFGNYTCKNIDQEKIIKQSLTKIIEKNIRRYSTDTNTQK